MTTLQDLIGKRILAHSLPDGGFEEQAGTGFRPDSTALAVLALTSISEAQEIIHRSLEKLASAQGDDGSLAIASGLTDVFWPTALALLAWRDFSPFHRQLEHSAQFLLQTEGRALKNNDTLPFGHNVSLRGWPWTQNTHSWVEPTAIALLALRAAGIKEHSRITEAEALLLDRQLPTGGWNYGNTSVFGQFLNPMCGPTGAALLALAGRVDRDKVLLSLDFLQSSLDKGIRAPLSLAWTLLGLGAWAVTADGENARIAESLALMERYRLESTSALSLLLLALLHGKGLLTVDSAGDPVHTPHGGA